MVLFWIQSQGEENFVYVLEEKKPEFEGNGLGKLRKSSRCAFLSVAAIIAIFYFCTGIINLPVLQPL